MTEEQYQYWLADMDDALERFFERLPEDVRSRLDFSLESLDALEGWALDRYPDPQAILEPPESAVLDGLARYVGETIRKNSSGHWELRTDDPSYAYHGIPQLSGFRPMSTPVAPAALVTTALDRRRGSFLRMIAGNVG